MTYKSINTWIDRTILEKMRDPASHPLEGTLRLSCGHDTRVMGAAWVNTSVGDDFPCRHCPEDAAIVGIEKLGKGGAEPHCVRSDP